MIHTALWLVYGAAVSINNMGFSKAEESWELSRGKPYYAYAWHLSASSLMKRKQARGQAAKQLKASGKK